MNVKRHEKHNACGFPVNGMCHCLRSLMHLAAMQS